MRPILMHFYTTILLAHVKLITDLRTDSAPIIFLPEQNTFMFDNDTLWGHLKEASFKKFGVKLFVYKQYNKNGEVEIGKLISGNKASLVLKLHRYLENDFISRILGVVSFGETIKSAFLNNHYKLTQELCATGSIRPQPTAAECLITPCCTEDFKKLTPVESVDFIFRHMGGFNVSVKEYDVSVIDAGAALVTKLGIELLAVSLKSHGKSVKVITGGKKNNKGTYSRDDLFSAFLLGSTMIGRGDESTDGIFTVL